MLGVGRVLFAVSIAAFGVENLIWARRGDEVTRMIPWLPELPLLVYLVGIAFLATGVCLAMNFRARTAAILLSALFLISEVFLQLPRAVEQPLDLSLRTVVFEVFTLCASALLLAATLPGNDGFLGRWKDARKRSILAGRWLMAVSSLVFGISHFLIPDYIASLIPAWIPGPGLFWAYFTGAGFAAAGLSFATGWMARWAGILLGAMFLLWFLLLHLPRVFSYPKSQDPAEWSSAFIALGICGGSWIAAVALPDKPLAREAADEAYPTGTRDSSAAL